MNVNLPPLLSDVKFKNALLGERIFFNRCCVLGFLP